MTSIESVAHGDVVQKNGSLPLSSCTSFFTLIWYFVYRIYCPSLQIVLLLFLIISYYHLSRKTHPRMHWDTSSVMFPRSQGFRVFQRRTLSLKQASQGSSDPDLPSSSIGPQIVPLGPQEGPSAAPMVDLMAFLFVTHRYSQ